MTTTKPVKKTAEKEHKHPVKTGEFTGRYKRAIGGRKTASAQVRLYPKNEGIVVNGKEYTKYFVQPRHQAIILAPLKVTDMQNAVGISAQVRGGGINAQAEAVRHGIAKALVEQDAELRKTVKREGFLTRDPRAVERKKYGLKKARRAPQWAKR